jgi:hypothetical protein
VPVCAAACGAFPSTPATRRSTENVEMEIRAEIFIALIVADASRCINGMVLKVNAWKRVRLPAKRDQ